MNTLLNIAEKHIPKISSSTKYNRPWFNEECKKLSDYAEQHFKKIIINPTQENLKTYKKQQSQSSKNNQRLQKKYMEKLCCQNK